MFERCERPWDEGYSIFHLSISRSINARGCVLQGSVCRACMWNQDSYVLDNPTIHSYNQTTSGEQMLLSLSSATE